MRFSFYVLSFIVFLTGAPCVLEAKEAAVVRKVLDGELLELGDGRRVRLIGVVATEKGRTETGGLRSQLSSGQIASLRKLGPLAKGFVEKAVEGREVILSQDPVFEEQNHRDNKGNYLAYVWYRVYFKAGQAEEGTFASVSGIRSQDRMLNAEVIQQGYGFVDTSNGFAQQAPFLLYESQARESRRGVWRTQAEFFRDILKRGQQARSGSVADFVPEAAQELSLKTAEKTFNELIKMNPKDYRGYYERSWLGVEESQDRITERNLQDIEQAIKLSPQNPKCYVQKHFLLRLMGRYVEAAQAYNKGVELAAKLGMPVWVTSQAQRDLESLPFEVSLGEKGEGFVEDAVRANLNEEHFLIFMARYQELKSMSGVQTVFDAMLEQSRFRSYHQKYQTFLQGLPSRKILYKTKWALDGWEEPEKILALMES